MNVDKTYVKTLTYVSHYTDITVLTSECVCVWGGGPCLSPSSFLTGSPAAPLSLNHPPWFLDGPPHHPPASTPLYYPLQIVPAFK